MPAPTNRFVPWLFRELISAGFPDGQVAPFAPILVRLTRTPRPSYFGTISALGAPVVVQPSVLMPPLQLHLQAVNRSSVY